MVEALLFFAPASLIIIGALIVIFARNPVHNAMGLVMTLVSLAIIYITLNATFVAMVQMLVYAGAVMTLFLFVIMMIGVDKKEQSTDSIKGQTFLVSGVFLILISKLWFSSAAPLASTIGILLLTQISLGIINVIYVLPLYVAIAHNLVAATLLLATFKVNYLAWKK